jgi:hypothetical protein
MGLVLRLLERLEKSKQMDSFEKKLKENKPWIFND